MKKVKLPIISSEAEVSGFMEVPAEIFTAEVPSTLIALAVRKFLSNQRMAGAKAKTRGQIDGSGAKIWRQKHTGRARHGDRQASIFVGGGKAHGPTGEQNYHLALPKKMNRKAVYGALTQKFKEKKAFLLGDIKITKTKEAFFLTEKIKGKLSLKNGIVLVCSNGEEIRRFFGNLKEVKVLSAQSLNVYELVRGKAILLTNKALEEIIHQEK